MSCYYYGHYILVVSLTGSKNKKKERLIKISGRHQREGGSFFRVRERGAVFDRKIGTDHMTIGCKQVSKAAAKTAENVPESRVVP